MKISLKELQQHIRRGPALVFGPGMSTSPAREIECLRQLRSSYPDLDNDSPCQSFLDYVDIVLAAGIAPEAKVRAAVESAFLNPIFANPQLNAVVRPNWTAVVSLACDDFCRSSLNESLYAVPSKWTLTTVAEPDTTPALTTIPYYSLMGDIRDNRQTSRLAISRSEYLQRQRLWFPMLQSLPRILKSDPLIFLGTTSIVERVCDFLNELLKLQPQVPKRLIFLDGDPTASSPTLMNLVRAHCQIEVASCSLSDLGNALSRSNLAISSLPLFAEPTRFFIEPKVFGELEDQVAYVPRKEEIRTNPAERNRLLDSLFRPTHLDWSPYALSLEFRRDICNEAENRVKELFSRSCNFPILQLKGEAGIGKTVILRAIAFSLAQQGMLCLWVRRSYGELSGSRFDTVVTTLNDRLKRLDTEIVVFLDDPAASRASLDEVVTGLGKARFRWAVVVASRKTDDSFLSRNGVAEPVPEESTVEVPAEFSAAELERLPDYLVTIGAADSADRAKSMMFPESVKHSRDVLCSLWYLLPGTQSAIEESLVGEYRRLGEPEALVTKFANAAGRAKPVAKTAYEFVTTTSGFDSVPLPVEVLVSALGVSYGEWADNCHEKRPLWGLLYEEHYESAETYAYRTRNHIVTEVLLRTLNHGTAGHTGEFRCMKRLLRACTSASPQYRSFIMDILVKRRHLIEKRFNYQQAMELYEAALSAYPRALGVVEHHRCLVKRNLGGEAQDVYEELRRLIAKSYDRSIPDQDQPDNLHTSAAAALNQMIRENTIDAAEGGEAVFEHISAAIAIDQFSLHSYHVHAQTLIAIASAVRETNRIAFWTNVERAARIVSRALLLLEHTSREDQMSEQALRSARLFQDLRQDIIMAQQNLEAAREEAFQVFRQTGDQTALAFVGRILLVKATEARKGSLFKKVDKFLRTAFETIAASEKDPSEELLICRVELIIEWFLNQEKGPVVWEQFESDLLRILQNPRYSQDTLWLFYLGVTHYHLSKFVEAEACFQTLRSRGLPWEARQKIRCFYLGDSSEPKVLEGRLSPGAQNNCFVYSGELQNDILVRRGELSGRRDEIKHFRIGFSLYGPLAIDRDAST